MKSKRIKKYKYPELKRDNLKAIRDYKGRTKIYRKEWAKNQFHWPKPEKEIVSREEHYKRYKAFLQSSWWKDLRKRKLKECPNCFICFKTDYLQVHHAGYDNLWAGTPEKALKDTYVLCASCHGAVHFEQKKKKMGWKATVGIIHKFKREMIQAHKIWVKKEDEFAGLVVRF